LWKNSTATGFLRVLRFYLSLLIPAPAPHSLTIVS
jgi:hypothetical protein